MKAIIIEDEPLVAKDLKKLIAQLAPEIEIITILESVKKSVEYFKANPEPDLVFMDIQLSDGVSFDIFNQVELKCAIIFTTAYNEYAIRAFKVNSIDYLLKPIDKKDLDAAIKKSHNFKANPGVDMQEQLHSLIQHLSLPKESKLYKDRFTAHSGKSFVVINSKNIACFQKDTLIYITTTDKQQFITDFQTMEEIEDVVNPEIFFRANRQFIINANAVDSFRTDSYSKLVVKLKAPTNADIIISREKAQAFKNWLS